MNFDLSLPSVTSKQSVSNESNIPNPNVQGPALVTWETVLLKLVTSRWLLVR